MKTVYCPICCETFTTNYSNKKYCSKECCSKSKFMKHKNNAAAKIKKQQAEKFSVVDEFIKKHYEETGVRLSYGQAVALMERRVGNGVDR